MLEIIGTGILLFIGFIIAPSVIRLSAMLIYIIYRGIPFIIALIASFIVLAHSDVSLLLNILISLGIATFIEWCFLYEEIYA